VKAQKESGGPARAAVVTPPGEGGIGVIVLAGPQAALVLDAAFAGTRRRAAELPVGSIAHGRIVRGADTLDEVVVARVDAGGEPTFEVNCHGGVQAVRAVVQRLADAGAALVPAERLTADMADPRRALSAARIRTAALALLPRAQTRLGARMLLWQAGGALSRELDAAAADLPGRPQAARARLKRLAAGAPLAHALLKPPRVLLIGPPNVGKSTLMNALLRRERVIVHHRPGTTRDVVRETVSMRGVPLELMDSAGIRGAPGTVEQEAVRRARALIADCDAALVMFDVRRGPAWAWEHLDRLRAARRILLVGNKVDLLDAEPAPWPLPPGLEGTPQVFIAALEHRGIDRLEDVLLAPYQAAMAEGTAGVSPALPFTPELLDAVERVLAVLAGDGPQAALDELGRLR